MIRSLALRFSSTPSEKLDPLISLCNTPAWHRIRLKLTHILRPTVHVLSAGYAGYMMLRRRCRADKERLHLDAPEVEVGVIP